MQTLCKLSPKCKPFPNPRPKCEPFQGFGQHVRKSANPLQICAKKYEPSCMFGEGVPKSANPLELPRECPNPWRGPAIHPCQLSRTFPKSGDPFKVSASACPKIRTLGKPSPKIANPLRTFARKANPLQIRTKSTNPFETLASTCPKMRTLCRSSLKVRTLSILWLA